MEERAQQIVQTAIALAEEYGYRGVGGSDAHIVSFVGRCATRFDNDVTSMQDLVRELKGGAFEAVSFRD